MVDNDALDHTVQSKPKPSGDTVLTEAAPFTSASTEPESRFAVALVQTNRDKILAHLTNGDSVSTDVVQSDKLSLAFDARDSDFAQEIGSVRLTYRDHVLSLIHI